MLDMSSQPSRTTWSSGCVYHTDRPANRVCYRYVRTVTLWHRRSQNARDVQSVQAVHRVFPLSEQKETSSLHRCQRVLPDECQLCGQRTRSGARYRKFPVSHEFTNPVPSADRIPFESNVLHLYGRRCFGFPDTLLPSLVTTATAVAESGKIVCNSSAHTMQNPCCYRLVQIFRRRIVTAAGKH